MIALHIGAVENTKMAKIVYEEVAIMKKQNVVDPWQLHFLHPFWSKSRLWRPTYFWTVPGAIPFLYWRLIKFVGYGNKRRDEVRVLR
jgi:hypothetical protein